ncbi:MAG: Capsular polysaccharide export system inner membrane protein KpsE [uncultured Sulfurovum sp.]|uniref:Capsular polysaccharide export system inner membrane protein KpsE n=1 Tax=uncultured Sulfurovum sp. TaxID=269237 RepID=A0A6S6T9B5_9BACT|nr:MAG: Capsular polysaccharide export system inner membrane protein KpsE [uncultured Sulfurovum sp.]
MNILKYVIKLLFLGLFVLSIYYIFFIETEKYESQSIVMIKDLSEEQSSSALGSLLMAGTSSESMTDAMLLEVYVKSSDMFEILDKEFNFTEYYSGDDIDIFSRLSDSIALPFYSETYENLLLKYTNDLSVVYNEPSNTIKISFAHANAQISKNIVEKITEYSAEILNQFEKENTEVALSFLEKLERKKHALFISSLETLLVYQNKHNTIDPTIDIKSKSTILGGLESELIQKNVEYNSKSQYLNKSTAEMKLLERNISYIQKSIKEIRRKIAGGDGKAKLNVSLSDFSLLKSKLEFDKEVYMQTLIKLEETKVLVNQNRKNLIVVSHPRIADSYIYPNKIKDSVSVLIVLSFIYGILSLIIVIIKDHKD